MVPVFVAFTLRSYFFSNLEKQRKPQMKELKHEHDWRFIGFIEVVHYL